MPSDVWLGPPLQNELALLLLCARTEIDEPNHARIRALIEHGIDWYTFARLVRHHWLAVLVQRALRHTTPAQLPTEFVDELHASVQRLTWHGLLLLGELCKLMSLLTLHHVQAVPFKGPALSARAYGDPVVRFSGDLDILVPETEIAQARQLLMTLGYLSNSTNVLRDVPETAVHQVYHHELFTHPDTQVVIELHWKVDECEFIRPFDPLFSPGGCCPVPLTLGGAEMHVFSPECTVLLLCEHGAKHRWWQLRWICDIAEFVRRHPGIDWAQVETIARQSGNLRVLWLGLLLAHELLDGPVPAELVQRARADCTVVTLAREVIGTLHTLVDYADIRLDVLLFHIRSKERLTDRIKLFMHFTMLPAEADWTMVALPPALSFLYFIIRPLRLLQRYGSVCVKQLWRQPG